MKKYLMGLLMSLTLVLSMSVVATASPADDAKAALEESVKSQAQNIDTENVGSSVEEQVGTSLTIKQSGIGKNSIKVSWNAYSGAAGYFYAAANSDGKVIKSGLITSTSVTISGLTQGNVYGFAVAGVDSLANQLTEIVELVCVTTPTNTKVQKMYYTSSGKYQPYLSYSQSTVGYRFQMYNYATKKTATKYYTTNKPAIALSRKTAYKMTITPYTTLNGKKSYGGKTVHYAMSPPAVKKKSNTNSSTTVQWTKMSGVNNYSIYVKKPGGSFKKMTTTTGSTYTVKGMKINQSYAVKVVANKKVGGKTYTSPTQYYYTVKLVRY